MNDSPPKPQTYRRAGFEDARFICQLVEEAFARMGAGYGVAFDRDSTLCLVDDVIRRGLCLVGENSCAGALLSSFPSNNNSTVAYVAFWNFLKPREITIFTALAEACREAGATHINAGAQWPENPIGRFYQKHGMTAAEMQYFGPIEMACNKVKV